jgi:hypothetical protein
MVSSGASGLVLLLARVRGVPTAPLGLVAAGLACAGDVVIATTAWRVSPSPKFAYLVSDNNCAQDRVKASVA